MDAKNSTPSYQPSQGNWLWGEEVTVRESACRTHRVLAGKVPRALQQPHS